MSSIATWHEVECGGYAADLDAWERLAGAAGDPILELGSGIGRVALHLARLGHEVWAVDREPALLEVLEARASAERLPVHAERADIRALDLDQRFALIAAPMQVIQMLDGPRSRSAALVGAARHLAPGGRLAAAIVERPGSAVEGVGAAAIPDVREVEGWVYSSHAESVTDDGAGLDIRRRRQAVSPDGDLSEEEFTERLEDLDAERLEAEAEEAGLGPAGRVAVPSTEGYLGSMLVILEAV